MPGVLRHDARDVKISVHVEDLLITGTNEDLSWVKGILSEVYQMKFQMVGTGWDLEAADLNRTLRWTTEGIEWVPQRRHVQKILDDLAMTNANPVRTPLTTALFTPGTGELLCDKEARRYRAVAARITMDAGCESCCNGARGDDRDQDDGRTCRGPRP